MARPLVEGHNHWPDYQRFREQFVDALDITHTADWLDRQVYSNNYRLFSDEKAAILAEITTHPSGVKSVDGVLAAGDPANIKQLIPLAEAWGRNQGAAFASIDSRPAWSRLLPDYQIDQVRIVKDLSDGIE